MPTFGREIHAAYEKMAKYYSDFRFEGKAVNNEYIEMPATLSLIGNVKGKKVLDLGCGPGIYAEILKKHGAEVHGLDLSEKMIEIAKKRVSNVDFKVGTVYKMPYKNSYFDVVVAAYVVHYFKDFDRALREIHRVLKKDGIFVFSTTNPIKESSHHLNGKPRNVRVFKDYFKEGKKETIWWNGTKHEIKISYIHLTMETYIKKIIRNGFMLLDYKDAKPIKSARYVDKETYNLGLAIPLISVFKVKKL